MLDFHRHSTNMYEEARRPPQQQQISSSSSLMTCQARPPSDRVSVDTRHAGVNAVLGRTSRPHLW